MDCKNCGETLNGRYCSHCGADNETVNGVSFAPKDTDACAQDSLQCKNPPADGQCTPDSAVMPELWEKCCTNVAEALESQQKYHPGGTIDREFLNRLKKGHGIDEMLPDIHSVDSNLSQEPEVDRYLRKEALKSIQNKRCPGCSMPFTAEEYCRCCGAPLNPDSYNG